MAPPREALHEHLHHDAAGLAAGLVVAVVGWNLLPRQPGFGGEATPLLSPTTTPASIPPTEAARPWWLAGTSGPCGEAPLPYGCEGELNAGTHTSGGFQLALTYRVAAGWVNYRDWATYFAVFPDSPSNRAVIDARTDPTTDILVRKVDGQIAPCDGASPSAGDGNAANALGRIAARHGALAAASPATIGPLSGQTVDVSAKPDFPLLCVGATAPPVAPDGGRYRVIVLDSPDGGLIEVEIRASPAEAFDVFAPVAMQVVESMTFATP